MAFQPCPVRPGQFKLCIQGDKFWGLVFCLRCYRGHNFWLIGVMVWLSCRQTQATIDKASTPAKGSEKLVFDTVFPRTFMQQVGQLSCTCCELHSCLQCDSDSKPIKLWRPLHTWIFVAGQDLLWQILDYLLENPRGEGLELDSKFWSLTEV